MKDIDYIEIIKKYIDDSKPLYRIYMIHAVLVTGKALTIARRLKLEPEICLFIEQASMLHDIGVVMVDAPDIDCRGTLSYIEHGVAGRKLLETEGLFEHALVCERHIGLGLTRDEILEKKLLLPPRDMIPITIAEEIVCFSDLFFSKSQKNLWHEKKMAEVIKTAAKYDQLQQFTVYAKRYLNKPQLELLDRYTCRG